MALTGKQQAFIVEYLKCWNASEAARRAAARGGAMTTFPNAPASHSALFDNAPTVPPAVPAHLTPATRISQDRSGQWYAKDVFMQYGAPVPLALALTRVKNGRTVFVAREDAGAVMDAANAGVTDGESNG